MKKLTLTFLVFLLPLLAFAQGVDYDALNQTAKEHLINLINIDTAQPEPNETAAARYIYKVLNKNKIDWDIYRAEKPRANLIAVLKADKEYAKKNKEEALIMIAHLDTAAVQEGWTMPPLKAIVKDGRIYGLGSSDAKNYAAVNLTILTWLRQNKIKLNRDIIFLFTADEENGSAKGIRFLYDKYPHLLKAGYALNEGGGFIHTENGVKDIMFVEAASKMYMDILLTATGSGGHASMPAQANAIYRLSQALSVIEAHRPPPQMTPFTRVFFEKIYSALDDDAKTTMGIFLNSKDAAQREQAGKIISEDAFFRSQLTDTISPTVLTSGTESNTLAAEAHATLNCRLLPDSSPTEFFTNLSLLFAGDDNISLTVIEKPELPFPQPAPGGNDYLFKAIQSAVEYIRPGALTAAGIGPASNESEFLRRHGVTAYGIGPSMDKLHPGPHQADESIAEEDFYEQLALTLSIVRNMAEIKE